MKPVGIIAPGGAGGTGAPGGAGGTGAPAKRAAAPKSGPLVKAAEPLANLALGVCLIIPSGLEEEINPVGMFLVLKAVAIAARQIKAPSGYLGAFFSIATNQFDDFGLGAALMNSDRNRTTEGLFIILFSAAQIAAYTTLQCCSSTRVPGDIKQEFLGTFIAASTVIIIDACRIIDPELIDGEVDNAYADMLVTLGRSIAITGAPKLFELGVKSLGSCRTKPAPRVPGGTPADGATAGAATPADDGGATPSVPSEPADEGRSSTATSSVPSKTGIGERPPFPEQDLDEFSINSSDHISEEELAKIMTRIKNILSDTILSELGITDDTRPVNTDLEELNSTLEKLENMPQSCKSKPEQAFADIISSDCIVITSIIEGNVVGYSPESDTMADADALRPAAFLLLTLNKASIKIPNREAPPTLKDAMAQEIIITKTGGVL